MYSMNRISAPASRANSTRSHELIVVVAARDDRVELEIGEAGAASGLDAREDVVERVHSREPLEPVPPQRVEADRDAMESSLLELTGGTGEQHAVGRQSEIVEPGSLGEGGHERCQVASKERLAAGQPEPVDAHLPEQVGQLARSPRR